MTVEPLARRINASLHKTPNRILFRYLDRGETESAALSAQSIDSDGRRVAASLVDAGLIGATALLVLGSGPGFLQAMLGCLYAGVVAVPAPEPRPGASGERLQRIVAAAKASVLITSAALVESLRKQMAGDGNAPRLTILTVEALLESAPASCCPGFDVAPHVPIIVQFTSGSTSAPRGVVLDSACVIANSDISSRCMGMPDDGRAATLVNWMPHYHDMGLMGKILTPLLQGYEVIHMSPLAFVQRPARWLQAISRYRATTSGGPAFAFDLCAARVSDEVLATLDLSAWRVAFAGAEPVRAATLSRFRERFATAGFRPEALFSCYGLAETTLYVAGGHAPAGASLGGEGRAPCYLEAETAETIRIVGADGRCVAPGEQGEIWVCGPSVAQGYLEEPVLTAATFQARLDPDDGRQYLRTGDLGRIDGNVLTVTGRMKDTIIRNGANVAAADVEWAALQDGLQSSGQSVAAFQGPDSVGNPVVLVVEKARGPANPAADELVVRRIKGGVARRIGLDLDEVMLVRAGSLPRTTSGKVRRGAIRESWIAGTLGVGAVGS